MSEPNGNVQDILPAVRPNEPVLNRIGTSVAVTANGLAVDWEAGIPTPDDINRAAWLGHDLRETGTWAAADAILLARELGDRYVQELNLNYSPGTMNNMAGVAFYWPRRLRIIGVPYSFHLVVQPLMRMALLTRDNRYVEMARTWLMDAQRLGWTRDELAREYKQYTIPPSMRTEEPEQLVIPAEPVDMTVRPTYTHAEFRAATVPLLEWAKRNGCPQEILRPVELALGGAL